MVRQQLFHPDESDSKLRDHESDGLYGGSAIRKRHHCLKGINPYEKDKRYAVCSVGFVLSRLHESDLDLGECQQCQYGGFGLGGIQWDVNLG
jgi:hypothetical protein